MSAASAICVAVIKMSLNIVSEALTRRGDPACREADDRQALETRSLLEQVVRRADLLRVRVHLLFAHHARLSDLAHDRALVANCLYDVACASLTLCTDEGRTLGDSAKSLAQVACTADERHLERVLVDVVLHVCRREDFGLIDVVDADGLEDLRCDRPSVQSWHMTRRRWESAHLSLHEMSYTDLGHDGDGHGLLNLLDH